MKRLRLSLVLLILGVGSVVWGQTPQGSQIFQQNCAVCHGNQGRGEIGPALAGNQNLQDEQHVIQQILYGGQQMPPFSGQLSDEQIAAVATYVRTSWGNDFGPIEPQQVADNRLGAGEQQQGRQQEQPAQPQQQATEQQGQEAAEGQQPAPQAKQVTIKADTSTDPARLVDGQGMALYRFVYDAPEGTPHCYEPCTNRWMPVLVADTPSAGDGVDGGALGTVERDDGTLQATYKGWPLYRFSGDAEAGQVGGDAVSDVWTSVTVDVEEVQQATGAPLESSPSDVSEQQGGEQQGAGEQDGN